jgi:putative DNA primase/helicase
MTEVESKVYPLAASKIPKELQACRQWVAWKVESRDGKPTKVPVNPITGQNAASNKPETWGSLEEATRYYETHHTNGCAGIGFMFSKNDPFTGVDLDKCRRPETGAMPVWAQEIINRLASYTEVSPSGTGLHILVQGELPPGGNRKGHIEMYSHGRYFTMTGNHLEGTPLTIEDRDSELKALHAQIFATKKVSVPKEPAPVQPSFLSDQTLIEKAKNAANGEKFTKLWGGDKSEYPSQSEADLALCSILAFWTGCDPERMDSLFRQSGLMRQKWDEKHYSDGRTYGAGVIQEAIANSTQVYTGEAPSSEVDIEQEIVRAFQDVNEDTPRKELLQRMSALVPVLAKVSNLEIASALEDLKSSLKLTDKDIGALEKDIKAARKDVEGVTETPKTYTASFDGLVDLVEHEGKVAFLVKGDDGKLAILPEVKRNGMVYAPPPKDGIPFRLPRGQEVMKIYEAQEKDEDLYDALLAYHQGISELPGAAYYDLMVAWDFHTYLLETVQYSPIICHFADPERGKSRTGKGMIFVAYRGIHVESLREAYILRVADGFQASIFFDVMDIWKKATKSGAEDILLHRFEKGLKVPRVLYPDRGPFQDTVFFKVFGPTIVATNESVHRILDTRGVQINMPQTGRRFENDVTPELALPLKERLVAFRGRHLRETLPDIPKPASGRLGDILKPLLQIIRLVKPEREPIFLNLVRELETRRKIDRVDSLEAQILRVIDGMRDRVARGILPYKMITDAFNEGKSEKYHFTTKRMGAKLSAMGFEKGFDGEGAAAIIWNEEKLQRLMESQGLLQSSASSASSAPTVPAPDESEETDHSEGGAHSSGVYL